MSILQFCRSQRKLAHSTGAGVECQDEVGQGGGLSGAAFPRPLLAPASSLSPQSSHALCFVLCFWPLHTQLCLDDSLLTYVFFLKPRFLCRLPLLREHAPPPWPSQHITSTRFSPTLFLLTAWEAAHVSFSLLRCEFFEESTKNCHLSPQRLSH